MVICLGVGENLLLLLLSHVSPVRLRVTPQIAAHQAPPTLGFSRQEYWSALPFRSPNSITVSHKLGWTVEHHLFLYVFGSFFFFFLSYIYFT